MKLLKIIFRLVVIGICVKSKLYSHNDFKNNLSAILSAGNQIEFIENKGQLTDEQGLPVPQVLFKTPSKGIDIFITTSGISYVLNNIEKNKNESEEKGGTIKEIKWHRIDMMLDGATIEKSNVIAEYEKEGSRNYYLSHCPDGILNVKSYGKITVKEIYPGIDWVLYADENKTLAYDFIVHPGADASRIKMNYKGASALVEDERVILQSDFGKIEEGQLFVYQPEQHCKKKIESTFALNNNQVSFSIGNYNRDQTLVIDPPLVWSTYFGGSNYDVCSAITTDATGNVCVAGSTSSVPFPTNSADQGTAGGNREAFVSKFNSSGTLQWSTYFGGSGDEFGYSVCTDMNGNIFATGLTESSDLPYKVKTGAYNQITKGSSFSGRDIFIVKYNTSGIRTWATYFGGSGDDVGYGIASDIFGNIFITGSSVASAGATVAQKFTVFGAIGSYTMTAAGGYDGFILKFNNADTLLWSTPYGGSGYDEGHAIATDAAGNVYITGGARSVDFPITPATAPQLVNGGGGQYDVIVVKFSNTGVRQWATYYGGNNYDIGNGIAIDASGNICIAGQSFSPDFKIINSGCYYTQAYATNMDACILKFTPSGSLMWATYIGGNSTEEGNAIAADLNGNIYITGRTMSTDFPLKSQAGSYNRSTFLGGSSDIYISEFDCSNNLVWSTYYAGSGYDQGYGLAVDFSGNLYLDGFTQSTNIATKDSLGSAYIQAPAGNYDGLILKFINTATVVSVGAPVISSVAICTGKNTILTASSGCKYNWSTGQTTVSINVSPNTTTTYTVTVSNGSCQPTIAVQTISVIAVSASITGNNIVCSGQSTSLTAANGSAYLWNTGATENVITVSPFTNTSYSVIVSIGNCSDTAYFSLIVNTSFTITTSADVTISLGSSTELSATGGGTYSWSPSTGLSCITCANTTASPVQNTTYCVLVNDGNGCKDSACINVTIPELPCGELFIPSAFSPNNDGKNDILFIMSNCIKVLDFTIYDRWGEKVFATTDPATGTRGWDGSYKHKPLSSGMFIYHMEAILLNGEKIVKQGNICLIR